jgi:hypothetical protein
MTAEKYLKFQIITMPENILGTKTCWYFLQELKTKFEIFIRTKKVLTQKFECHVYQEKKLKPSLAKKNIDLILFSSPLTKFLFCN